MLNKLGNPRSVDHVLQFFFRLYKGSVKSAEVVDFLKALLRHIPGPLLIIWDRLSAHRSKITRDFTADQGERLWVEYLPGYAPELNPRRIYLGVLEAACPAQCLPDGLLELGRDCTSNAEKNAPTSETHRCLLAAA